MKKILFSFFLLVIPYLSSLEPDDYDNLKIHYIRVTCSDDAYFLIKNDRKNVFYLYEIELEDFLRKYDDLIFSLYEIDLSKFVQLFDYLPLEKAKQILPTYEFTEENYGL